MQNCNDKFNLEFYFTDRVTASTPTAEMMAAKYLYCMLNGN